MTIPDNYSRYELHEAEEAEYERLLPICDKCGDKCIGDYAYEVDGDLLCESCFEDWTINNRIDLEEYVQDHRREEW